jgi:hypothetical protein
MPPQLGVLLSGFDVDHLVEQYRVRVWPRDLTHMVDVGAADTVVFTFVFDDLDGTEVAYRSSKVLGRGSYGVVMQVEPVDATDRRFPVFALKRLGFEDDSKAAADDNDEVRVFAKDQRRLRRAMLPGLVLKGWVVMHVGIDLKVAARTGLIAPFGPQMARIAQGAYALQQLLADHRMVYTDVKLDNLYLVPAGNMCALLFFGDYGGLCDLTDVEPCIATFPPPEQFAHFVDDGDGDVLAGVLAPAAMAPDAVVRYSSALLFVEGELVARGAATSELYDYLGYNSDLSAHQRKEYLELLQVSARDAGSGLSLARWLDSDPARRTHYPSENLLENPPCATAGRTTNTVIP